MTATATGIGTIREHPLHAALKRWYALPGDGVEVAVDGYVIDLVRDGLLIEIQTRGFASMRSKLVTLLAKGHRLRIVYPIAQDTWIVKLDADGEPLSRRRSPRHGQPADLFSELVSFPVLLARPALEIELVTIVEEQRWRRQPGGSWRRRGWAITERRLVEALGRQRIRDPADLARLLPVGLPERFTTAELASLLGRPQRLAQQMAYCLRLTDVITPVGRRGHAVEYRLGVATRPGEGAIRAGR